MRQLLPHYVVRPESAPATFDVHRASKRAWRGTNASVKALGDDYLAGLSLEAPILIVQGEQDVIRETNAVLAERFPDAKNVRIPDASHFPWLEQPRAFSSALLDFYRSVVETRSLHHSS
jgi:pimeloyl-ACP methyl ester carboxylesterase